MKQLDEENAELTTKIQNLENTSNALVNNDCAVKKDRIKYLSSKLMARDREDKRYEDKVKALQTKV